MDVDDTESESDSQQERNTRANMDSKHLKHVYDPYFKRLFNSTGFIKHMNQRCSGPNDSTSYILLCEAIKRNDNISAQALVQHYCKSNMGYPDPGKDIPLHLAILAGNVTMVELLLSRGARACISFQDQREPLHLVCDRAASSIPDEGSRISMAKLLLAHGANVNALEKTRRDTPLILAVRSKFAGLAELLIERGAERHYANKYSETVLHAAFAEHAGNHLIELVYDEGFDLQQQDANGCSLFAYAVRNLMNSGFGSFCNLGEPVRAVLFLIDRGVPVNTAIDKRANQILHMICQNHAAQTAKVFLDRGAEVNARNADGRTALHFCAESQPLEILELLLSHGADVTALTNSGQSAVHFAAANKNPGVLEALLRRGLDVNAKGRDGNFTPLFNAVWSNRCDNVRLLLDWRVRVNERIINSQIGLHVAVDQKHAECVELLLEHGSDVNVLDDYGNTPLTISLYQVAELANSSDSWAWGDDPCVTKPTEDCQRALTRHVAKLFVIDQQLLSEQSIRIMDNEHFRDYYVSCLKELNLMKHTKLDEANINFFDMLTKKDRLLSCLGNAEFADSLRNGHYKERFPIYAENLQRVVDAAILRFELLKSGAENLIRLVQNIDKSWAEIHLPSLIVEQILGCLNLSDLRSLMAVYNTDT